MKHTFFFCIAAALTLAACTNDDENLNGGPVAAQVTAGIDVTQTREPVHPARHGQTVMPSAFPPQAIR